MPAEKFVTKFVKEAGFTPIPDRAIIVTYAPSNMSERIVKFFSNEFFALQKELSEWRHSGTLSVGMSGFGSGILGSSPLKAANWHRANLDATLAALKTLPGRKEEIA